MARVTSTLSGRQRKLAGYPPAAVWLLGLWLLTTVVGLAPELHHFFHPDSHGSSHECAVTLLSQGQLLTACTTDTTESPAWWTCESQVVAEACPAVSVDYLLSPSRAPPFLLSLSPVAI